MTVVCPLCNQRVLVLTRTADMPRHKHGRKLCRGSNVTTITATVLLAQEIAKRDGEVGGHG